MIGERHVVDCGAVAHGGFVVARLDGVVVFVRYALPGERVEVEITEGAPGARFLRADAIRVIDASPDRVEPPCRYYGRCGGCDLQHVSSAAQRAWKAAVIAEQFQRLARIDVSVEVAEVDPTLGWRSRMRYVDGPDGRGLRGPRSHAVVPLEECLIAAPDVQPTSAPLTGTRRESVDDRTFEVAARGFWQPHVHAPEVLVSAVLELGAPQPGESALDLYAGVGLFAGFLEDAGCSVTAVEGDREAGRFLARNITGTAVVSDVQLWLRATPATPVDLVVLDPPRVGAKRKVVEGIVARRPGRVVYVACDPAALARDVAIFAEHDYELAELRAFDLFPMTHHVEVVAELVRSDSGPR